jgi:carboxypeptidase PM20D1
MPQEAYVTANVRFIPHQGVEETTKILGKKAKEHNVEMQVINASEPCPVVDIHTQQFKMLEETIKEVFPAVVPCPYAMTGGTDSRFYTSVCDNVYRFAPLEITTQQRISIHGIDENIDTKTLPQGVDFYKTIVKKCIS